MKNIKNSLSGLKQSARNKIANVQRKLKNGTQKFQENFAEAKSKPRSKRKSLFFGFSTVLGIFGITLLAPILPAIAKDLPKNGAKPGGVCPTPAPAPLPSEKIIGGLAGVCALAATSSSFLIGAAFGVIIVIGILKAQGK